jgi:hypothetical protein
MGITQVPARDNQVVAITNFPTSPGIASGGQSPSGLIDCHNNIPDDHRQDFNICEPNSSPLL